MRFDWYDADNVTLATDQSGNILTSKAVQSWYNPPKIDPIVKETKAWEWPNYLDLEFDWIWGVPTAKNIAGEIKNHAVQTIDGVKNIVPKVGSYLMMGLVLTALIVIVPRVLAVKG